jgi:NAD(P)-dependent dehydrogenase (short-subunit alcohol dehydrogenase family)
LKDKVAVITGAASGIGRASALRFAQEGACVAVADIDGARANQVVRAIEAAKGEAFAIEVDVSDEQSVARMGQHVLSAAGRIDVVYANAGVSGTGTALETDLAAWTRTMAVNVTGAWLTARVALPSMMAQGRGSIIFQASVSATIAFRRTASYSASKGAVIALARQMSLDYARHDIRVNAICPGTIPTPLLLEASRKDGQPQEALDPLERYGRRLPLGRLGSVEDVANLALFLGSDESTWITGAAYPVDGGMSAL